MKKLLEDFKTLDNSWKFIIVGSLIGLVGYVMSETVTYEFWYLKFKLIKHIHHK